MTNLSKNINPIGLTQALFFINATFWLLLGGVSLVRQVQGHTTEPAFETVIITTLIFGNVAAMLWSGIELGKQQKRFYYQAVMLLTINIILMVTGDLDLFNTTTILIDVAILGLLIATRESYTITPDGISRLG
jgi:hypothetical protein